MAKRGLARRGDVMFRQDGNVSVCVWQDTRPVTFMSSYHNPAHTTLVSRRRVDGSIMNVECPVSIRDYNMYMGGVDRGDQLRKYYHVHVKSCKSYKYIFWYLKFAYSIHLFLVVIPIVISPILLIFHLETG